jgi:hypothetical protein
LILPEAGFDHCDFVFYTFVDHRRLLHEQHPETADHQADEPNQNCAEKKNFANHHQILAQPRRMDIDP